MPTSRMQGDEEWTPHLIIEDACGIIGGGPRSAVAGIVATHFTQDHPDVRVIAEGETFTVTPAPWRCDLCNDIAELPYWSHRSTPPTDVGSIIDHDGLWLVCDPCHGLVMAKDLTHLVRRWVAVARQQSPGLWRSFEDTSVARAEVTRVIRTLLERFDAGVREELTG